MEEIIYFDITLITLTLLEGRKLILNAVGMESVKYNYNLYFNIFTSILILKIK